MIINNNMNAMNAHRNMSFNTTQTGKAMEKLSSGLRINRAGDDAAGLAISEKMRGQIRGLDQASRNAQDGISLIQTAEGALNETHNILQRMRELAVQSSTDTNTATDRSEIQKEVDELAKEITRISNTSEFNQQNLLAGGLDNTFQIGANKGQNINLSINAMDAHSLGVAASKIDTSIATANGVSNISNVTQNLGVDAEVQISVTDASGSVTQGDITGTIAIVDATAYSGNTDRTIDFEITDATAGAVSQIEVNGTTIDVSGGEFDLGNGVSITIATDAANVIGNAGSIQLTAKTAEIQLANDAGNIGSAVVVRGNQTGVVVGDAATNRTANVSFDFNTLTDGDAAITQTIDASTEATVDASGNVVNGATVKAGINVSTQSAANNAIETINNAIESVSGERSKLGAYQNRLEHTISNLGTSAENLQAAESRIRDVDMAKEMMNFTKNNILNQAAQAMLAQAKSQPEAVLQLLR